MFDISTPYEILSKSFHKIAFIYKSRMDERSLFTLIAIQAEYTRHWLGYPDTYDTFNYCVFSEELTRCDLVFKENSVLVAHLLKL